MGLRLGFEKQKICDVFDVEQGEYGEIGVIQMFLQNSNLVDLVYVEGLDCRVARSKFEQGLDYGDF